MDFNQSKAAALMKKQSKSQAEAESWTAMAKMTVSAIDGMQRHGDIYNPALINCGKTSKAIFGLGRLVKQRDVQMQKP